MTPCVGRNNQDEKKRAPPFVPAPAPFGSRAWKAKEALASKPRGSPVAVPSPFGMPGGSGGNNFAAAFSQNGEPPTPAFLASGASSSAQAPRSYRPSAWWESEASSEGGSSELAKSKRRSASEPAADEQAFSEAFDDARRRWPTAQLLGIASLKRTRFSPSAATGLIGLEENSFIGTFSRDFLPFLPLLPETKIRASLIELIQTRGGSDFSAAAAVSSSEGSFFGEISEQQQNNSERAGSIVPAAANRASVANCASLWAAMALGAFLQGAGPEVCTRYLNHARRAVDQLSRDGGEAFPELVRTLLLMACIDDVYAGDMNGFVAYTYRAVKVCADLPDAARLELDRLFEWFDIIIRFRPPTPAQWAPSEAPDILHSNVSGLSEPLACHLRRRDVHMFLITLDRLFSERARERSEEPWKADVFVQQLPAVRQALAALQQVVTADRDKVGAMTEINLLGWQILIEMYYGDKASAVMLCRRYLYAVEKSPGVARFTDWAHRTELVAYKLHHLGCMPEYERMRALINRHNMQGIVLLPFIEADIERDFCRHHLCREALRFCRVLPEEHLQVGGCDILNAVAAVRSDAGAATNVADPHACSDGEARPAADIRVDSLGQSAQFTEQYAGELSDFGEMDLKFSEQPQSEAAFAASTGAAFGLSPSAQVTIESGPFVSGLSMHGRQDVPAASVAAAAAAAAAAPRAHDVSGMRGSSGSAYFCSQDPESLGAAEVSLEGLRRAWANNPAAMDAATAALAASAQATLAAASAASAASIEAVSLLSVAAHGSPSTFTSSKAMIATAISASTSGPQLNYVEGSIGERDLGADLPEARRVGGGEDGAFNWSSNSEECATAHSARGYSTTFTDSMLRERRAAGASFTTKVATISPERNFSGSDAVEGLYPIPISRDGSNSSIVTGSGGAAFGAAGNSTTTQAGKPIPRSTSSAKVSAAMEAARAFYRASETAEAPAGKGPAAAAGATNLKAVGSALPLLAVPELASADLSCYSAHSQGDCDVMSPGLDPLDVLGFGEEQLGVGGAASGGADFDLQAVSWWEDKPKDEESG